MRKLIVVLCVGILVGCASSIGLAAVAAESTCSVQQIKDAECTPPPPPPPPGGAGTGGGRVTLWGTQTTPGTEGDGDDIRGGGNGDQPADPNRCEQILDDRCFAGRELPAAPPTPGTPAVTLTDIATFRPTAAVSHMQPNGWAIAGLDTNFYATGTQHVVDGVLLGQPASVRFTPVAWHWNYGDTTTATLAVAGAPWPGRKDEFNPTPTSHIYHQRAPLTITLTVDFAAEYRYAGGPWITIPGTLPIPANDLQITVGTAKTVLVNENCNQNPLGPGC